MNMSGEIIYCYLKHSESSLQPTLSCNWPCSCNSHLWVAVLSAVSLVRDFGF